jgi:hypothetical protein
MFPWLIEWFGSHLAWSVLEKSFEQNWAVVEVLILVVFCLGALAGARWQRQRMQGKSGPNPGFLAIHKATWGPNEGDCKDVTAKVRERVVTNSINLPVENAVFGDPYPGIGKHFTVWYSIVTKQTIPESPTPNRFVVPPAAK